MQYDEDKGISGNNRTSHLADAYFEQYTNNGQILFGVGNQTIQKSMEVLPKVQVLMIKLEAQAIRYFYAKWNRASFNYPYWLYVYNEKVE